MSDPNFKPQEEPAPPKPPRPTTRQQQEAEDERLARQMFAHEQAAMQRAAERQRRQEQPYTQDQDEDASTFEGMPGRTSCNPRTTQLIKVETPEDFAAFRENLRQGFNTTQQKFNSWMTDFRKRIDGDDEPGYGREDEIGPGPASQRAQRQNFGPSQREQLHGIQRQAAQGRRSTDQDRYDADPRVLSDNFSELELRDEGIAYHCHDLQSSAELTRFAEAEETPPQKPSRPLANPNLFKPTPATPSPIAPQSGPVDEVDALYRQPTTSTTSNSPHIPTLQQRSPSPATSATKSKKWQPLTSVAPAPEAEEHDPFSVGDSEEDEESKREKATDLKKEDTERLKRSSGQVGGSGGEKQEGGKSFGPSERSGSVGSRDKTAEEILKGEKSG